MASDNIPEGDEVSTAPIHSKGPVDDDEDGHSPFPIVGIGASAGGLEAYQQLLTNVPADTGMVFVLVQHLDPHHESRLSEVLSRATPMPVIEAAHDIALQANTVYVIPPNSNLAIHDCRFNVTPRGEGRRPHLPIDYLFRSLAEEQKARAIGVVLSGTGADGTQGLCEIKAVGGITFAQDEKSARFNGMPASAAASGCADFISTAQEIGSRLARIGKHPYLVPDAAPAPKLKDVIDETHYQRILARVHAVVGVDFSLYRDTTIKRRIMRRMALHTQESIESYAERIEADDAEAEALYRDLLINVTSFFRDREVFDTLKQIVFPRIAREKPPTAPIRVWVPGCSTGQEAYSIALALVEFFDDRPVRPAIQIFATDLADVHALEKARSGVYPQSIEAEVSPERLRRFFIKEDHTYRIGKAIRDMCVFARQNVAADPPFSHIDLISCRNVLIYLATPLHRRILPIFHYALNTPGFLLLGSAESVGENTDMFEMLDRNSKIYAKKATASRPHFQFSQEDFRSSLSLTSRGQRPPGATPADFQREADRILLGRYAPAGVLVNENLDIIQFRGRTSLFLEPPPGEPTTNLLKMAREGLFLELRNASIEAGRQNQPVRRDKVRVRSNGQIHEITLEVLPVRPPSSTQPCLLVLFHEAESAATLSAHVVPAPVEQSSADDGSAAALEQELLQVRRELAATKEYLQTMVEQQDAANEELRSANEEILSSNEELQSTNEELETAKEELQSTNEELTTVNEQLQYRNLQLGEISNDLTNLLNSAGIPIVMVGPDLCIRRFTAAAKKTMSLLPSDIGRPISDLKQPVDVPDLDVLLGEVIEQVQIRERELRDREGRWHLLRIHPYRTTENKIDGAVVLLLDIDQIKSGEEALRASEANLRLALEAGSAGTWHRDMKTGRILWDDLTHKIFGLPADVQRNQETFASVLEPDDLSKLEAARERAIEEHGQFAEEVRIRRSDGQVIWVLMKGQGSYNELNETWQASGVCIDITERKRLADEIQLHIDQLREADRRKDEFLATLAHELRNPLAPMTNAAQIMRNPAITPAHAEWCRDVIDRQVKQMARLLDDLLDMSRITRDVLQFRTERAELGKIIESAIETSRPLIDEKGHKIILELPDEVVRLDADSARLTQVFSNLLNNAAKYSEPGCEIRLSVKVEGNSVTVTVKDSGIGIAPELLPRIFDMFTQGDASGTQGGLGLGLTLAKRLVEMHKGTIDARSEEPGKGSEFIVRLPIAQGAGGAPGQSETPGSEDGKVQTPRRILVVDDRESQAQSLAMLLRSLGHDVRVAHNGPSALEIAADFFPELALIDIGLPGMSGYEVARRLREQPQFKSMLLIAQTGWGRDEDRQRSREAGFDHHLAKPIDHKALFRLLETVKEND
jgi:two-component system CheB/CheR fusion protein